MITDLDIEWVREENWQETSSSLVWIIDEECLYDTVIKKEYEDMLTTPVADIKNLNMDIKAGCVIGGTFIHYFTDKNIPWVHIDLGVATFVNSVAISSANGINPFPVF